MRIKGITGQEYEMFERDEVKEPWEIMLVDGRVKVMVQYRQGEAEDVAKLRRCLEMILKMENTTNAEKDTEEAARRC